MSTGHAGFAASLVLELLSLDDLGFTLGSLSRFGKKNGDRHQSSIPVEAARSTLTMLFMPNMLPIFS